MSAPVAPAPVESAPVADLDSIGSGNLQGANNIKRYIFAGSALFTLVSAQSRYTYKVSQAKGRESRDIEPGRFLVGVLAGPDNDADYRFLGIIQDGELTSKRNNNARSFAALRWTLDTIASGGDVSERIEVWHEGRCGRCARTLTVPESIANGLGPICASR